MKDFIEKHNSRIKGVISCFDRIIFKGYLPLNRPEAMERTLRKNNCLIKDFNKFVQKHTSTIAEAARKLAASNGCPYIAFGNRKFNKTEEAEKVLEETEIKEGLVCVLSGTEGCTSFQIRKGENKPRLFNAPRKCTCLYFFFIDPVFGWMHVRIQTWFPFTIQVYINGHEYLARQLDKHKIAYKKVLNAFTDIDDFEKAQKLSNNFKDLDWPVILSAFAGKVNPLMRTICKDFQYYWVIDQSEYATDVVFKSRDKLAPLFKCLVKHAMDCLSAEDVMTFLGRKLFHLFEGEVINDYKKRWMGARVKHRMKQNWIKMYDKHRSILRIETVVNQPYEFRVWRGGKDGIKKWRSMSKGVANMFRYAEVSLLANKRYLNALAVVDDIETPKKTIKKAGQTVRINGKGYKGFNPLQESDFILFAAVMRGEFVIHGFRNKDIRSRIFQKPADKKEEQRQSSRMSRLFKRLHVHKLIAKIPRSRLWKVSKEGHKIMTVFVKTHEHEYPNLLFNFST